ncbi:hypothetical protein E2C01_095835 [Portunus trituberculatus]|uniref:Uncharacterized protein n=1 Tax=Portunus trituberculatus TaxID=210409 RepID=A0A5B7K5B5_PORTR|nr:hypothetical protein [Portunus trituberculatus]
MLASLSSFPQSLIHQLDPPPLRPSIPPSFLPSPAARDPLSLESLAAVDSLRTLAPPCGTPPPPLPPPPPPPGGVQAGWARCPNEWR